MFDAYNPYNNLAYNNPYQSAYRNQTPIWQGTKFVSGLAEAQSYPTAPGTKTLLMDSQNDKFYIKENDFNGISRVSQYRFSKIEEPKQAPDDFITREEFNKWRENYESAIKQQCSASSAVQSTGPQSSASISEDNSTDAATSASPSSGLSQEQFHFN